METRSLGMTTAFGARCADCYSREGDLESRCSHASNSPPPGEDRVSRMRVARRERGGTLAGTTHGFATVR